MSASETPPRYSDAGAAERADPRLVSMLARLSRAAAVFAVVTGFLVLTGWALDIVLLKSVVIGMATMKPNTALAFVLAGVALWMLQPDRESSRTRIVAGACSSAVMTIGLLSLGENLAGWDLGIDQLLFTDSALPAVTGSPGRMAPTTALSFLLIGGALQLLALPGRRWHHLVRMQASAVVLISTLAVFGYAYGVHSMYRVPFYSSMAIHTAVVFLMLSLAVLCARARSGWTSVIVSRGMGGIMLRRALLPSIVLLFMLGLLRLLGESIGLYATEFGLALMVMLSVIVLTVFLWRNAIMLDEEDARRERAEKARTILAAIIETSEDAIVSRDSEDVVLSWNAGAEKMLGYTAAEMIGRDIGVLAPPERMHESQHSAWLLRHGRSVPPFESVRIAKDGREIQVQVTTSAIRNAAGNVVRIASIARDVTERKRAEVERAQLAAIVENSGDAIISRCLDRKILTWNAAAERMFGYAAAEVIGQNVSLMIPPDREEEATHTRAQLDRGRAVLDFETERLAKDGRRIPVSLSQSPIRDEHGTMVGVSIIFRDIAERKQAAERIDFLAQYDALTGLPNRRLLTDRLTLAMARDKRLGAMTALLLLDLDRFKQVNESLGHGVGDELLKAVTLRLRERLREVDTIARLGGDEFVVILESVAEKEQALRVAEKIVEAMEEAFVIGGEEIFITASVGVALHPDHADNLEKLIENAELAMYEAKRESRNTLRLYAPEQNSRRAGGFSMESKLRRALERDEFVLHFQPKVNIKTGAITGAEALIRWRNPELGLVSPADFIPLAEETGLIVPIGEWVLHSACAQASEWHRQGHPLSIAVNLSARQFHQKNLCEMVKQTLADSGLDAGYLEFEITESMIMRRPEQTIAMLQQLHDIGLTLSVDDFGTGYSSLSYLKRFPVHKLKVDQSFVRDLNENADDAAIVRTVIALARNLNLKTVAEGVETEQQLIFLAGLDCDEYQGYYFSKPVPAAEFLALLQSRQPAAGAAEPSQLSAATVNRIAAALQAPQ